MIINKDLNLIIWNTLFLEIFFDILAGQVWGGVIDVDHVVVLVVLHEDWVEVTQVETGLGVLIGGDDKTESQLVMVVLAELIKWLIV